MTDHVEVRRGHYADSVALMQVSAAVTAVEGVEAGLVAMATELNVALLGDLGFAVPSAGPDDLVVAVRAHDA
ncbi:MAG: FdrA family protein, partial [Nitriliruptoraceae bacterium]